MSRSPNKIIEAINNSYLCVSVIARAPRMSGIKTRALAAHDSSETTSCRAVRSLLRGRGAEGTQEPLRTSQGVRRKGKTTHVTYLRDQCTSMFEV